MPQERVQDSPIPAEGEKAASISFQWFVGNLALFSIASLAIGYLWLLSYARAEGIPLRVHADGVGVLVPWVAGTAAALLATPAGLLAMIAAMIRLPMLNGDASLHDFLRSVIWKGSADDGAMRMRISFWAFGAPMFVSASVLILRVAYDWPGHTSVWFIGCALIAAALAFRSLHRNATLVTPWWNSCSNYLMASLFVTGMGVGVPVGFMAMFGISSGIAFAATLLLGGFIWWMIVSLIAFGKRQRLPEAIRGLALGSLAILLVASAFPSVAASFAAASLRAMGLGGTTIDLRLHTQGQARVDDGRYRLVLDTGSQLYVRRCDARADQQGVDIIAWASVDYIQPHRRLQSDLNSCER